MPKITPALRPAHSVPSRSKNLVPRSQPMMSSTGKAPAERISACSIGGTSGSTSLTAIWLKPHLSHSISIKATAPALSPRPSPEPPCLGGDRTALDRPAMIAEQECLHGGELVVMRAGQKRVAAFDAVHEAVFHQEIQRAIDRDRRRPRHRFGEFVDHLIGAERTVTGP